MCLIVIYICLIVSKCVILYIGDNMRKSLAIILGKLFVAFGDWIGRGSTLPGLVALTIDPNLLQKFILPKTIVAVTGSSGKGSTSSTLAHVLREQNYKVAHNNQGANLKEGITSMLLRNSTTEGKITSDIIVYEVDERYTKSIFPFIKPNYVVITNVTRDQPPRNGHFDLVIEEIKKALTPDMHLILNGDDPLLQKFNGNDNKGITYYGIDQNMYSYETSKFENLNIAYCPKCQSKLEYHFYHFEALGDYFCPTCDFKRNHINYLVDQLNYDTGRITINSMNHIHVPQSILYSIYNTVAAFAAGSLIGLNEEKMSDDISKLHANLKLYNEYEYNNRNIYVLNNKNENSSTFNQSLLFLDRFEGPKTIVIGWKEISRRYEFDDLSWLYDIDFELLNNHEIDQIVCVGLHKYDIAVRLKTANMDGKKIQVFDTLDTAVPYVKENTTGTVFAILNFDYVIPFNTLMKDGDKK